ncbi:hypothetical protein S100390_v1c06330 [Spiroplasma sp. NBRC 100390]|uniref:lipoprotein n=1 Tax=unclassified Spiroplasma TaxID=2637901 RepID=UPI0008928C58|nr:MULTISPECIES: lipoprotein [unclassified Spiroplasma]AOX43970.1 hypothetical protein STU14_v1c06330 [Spiroplasma sp. TU-14]APE13440.1 hypothetical protein S100390_v1c06330 [Spiroplasma sp. NBRC 100390]
MKKLLTILTTVSLLTPTMDTIVSCNSKPKFIPDDDDSTQTTKDVEIMNNIKNKVLEQFKAFWNQKATIDINDYPDQVTKFQELVTNLKTNDGTVLIGEAIRQWRFLDQLLTAFQTEFNNLNREIANEYSNYYLNTTPLSIEPNDISFTLQYINFDNLAKLITVDNNSIMGITINFNIKYQVKFKDFEQPDKINGLVVIANDLEALSGIQKNLENYFISFIDELLKKQKYEIIDTVNRDFDSIYGGNTIWPIIMTELNARKIAFKNSPSWNSFYSSFGLARTVSKSDSVLSWAGEGYNKEKLTAENFLKYYKRKYFTASSQEDYYVKANITSFIPYSLTIENLPFNNKNSSKKLKTSIKVLIAKDFVDQKLNEFVETTLNLWQYYQIETYNDKLVFKMNQNDFDNLVKTTNSFSEKNNSYANLAPVFRAVFKIFNDKLDKKITRDTRIAFSNSLDKVKLIKQDSSFAFQLFRKQNENGYYPWLDINFSYNSFAYSFFFKPDNKETNTDKKDEFLQTIEFKVV